MLFHCCPAGQGTHIPWLLSHNGVLVGQTAIVLPELPEFILQVFDSAL
jgi:hypothetical protein